MKGRLRTKTHQLETVSRLRTRAALSPPWRPILGDWPEWLPRGAAERLSFEDDSQFQIDAFSFEDDPPFRPPEDAFCQIKNMPNTEAKVTVSPPAEKPPGEACRQGAKL